MGRPKNKPGEVSTTRRLLASGEREFARVGFYAARLEDIAARAGIRRSSLLHHFPSKRALYEAVVYQVFQYLTEALKAAAGMEGGVPERVRGMVRAFADTLDRRPALAAIILREFLDGKSSGRAMLLREVEPILRSVESALSSGRQVPPERPLRAAILQVAAGVLLRASAGSLRRPLWGTKDHAGDLAAALL